MERKPEFEEFFRKFSELKIWRLCISVVFLI